MSESARDLLVRGIAAAKSGDKAEARFYLEWVLRTDGDRRQQIDAWWWLSELSDDPAQKREYLENILAYDMGHAPARRSLAILDGRLDPAEVIDPTHAPLREVALKSPQPVQTEQFTCPRCQGQMIFSPDGSSLLCPYCHFEPEPAKAPATVNEQDFLAALATARMHGRAVGLQRFQCQGCGASFALASTILSLTCPYCASAHVIQQAEDRPAIAPEGLIPFGLAQDEARRALQQWLRTHGLDREATSTTPAGLYVPVWTFDVGGEIQWRQRAGESSHTRLKSVMQGQSRPVFFDDILVAASKKFTRLPQVFSRFSLGGLVPYDPGYLADWPAETYQLSAADASLAAREQAYERARQEVRLTETGLLAEAEEMIFSSAGLVIESFKLVLLPLWLARYHYRGMSYGAIVNGQTGHVTGKLPQGKLRHLLGDILK